MDKLVYLTGIERTMKKCSAIILQNYSDSNSLELFSTARLNLVIEKLEINQPCQNYKRQKIVLENRIQYVHHMTRIRL